MDGLIEFLRGPGFRLAMTVAIVGLAAVAFQSVAGLVRARMRAGNKKLDVFGTLVRTVLKLSPVRHFFGSRPLYTVTSVVFHAGILVVPLLYLGHIRLWGRGMDLAWPAIPGSVADVLTLTCCCTVKANVMVSSLVFCANNCVLTQAASATVVAIVAFIFFIIVSFLCSRFSVLGFVFVCSPSASCPLRPALETIQSQTSTGVNHFDYFFCSVFMAFFWGAAQSLDTDLARAPASRQHL